MNRHHVLSLRTAALLAAPVSALPLGGGPAHADSDRRRPDVYRERLSVVASTFNRVADLAYEIVDDPMVR